MTRKQLARKRKRTLPQPEKLAFSAVTCDSEAVVKRLERIESNYVRLDQLLGELEAKVPGQDISTDECVSANPKKPR